MTLSKKQHFILIVICISVLYSCNYWASQEEIKEKEKKEFTNKVESNKKQADLLVSTTNHILDVIDLCEDVTDLSTNPRTKQKVALVKSNQLQLLNEIKDASNSVMVSVPAFVEDVKIYKPSDSVLAGEKLSKIEEKIKTQKHLLEQLVDNNVDESITELSDSLIPVVNDDLEVINSLIK